MKKQPNPQIEDHGRRQELADFLRTRRAKVKPPEGGPFPSRRRTPGLRREEVAEMAGISVSWYTWLEQGREIHPSPELLSRLGQVLRLNAQESGHLFDLAGKAPPEKLGPPNADIPASLENLVMKLLRVPAYVMGERLDFLIWNRLFTEQLYDIGKLPKERRTFLDVIFTQNTNLPSRPEWREEAKRAVAEFRWSVGKQIGNPWVKEVVNRMCRESPDFAEIWRLHDVEERKKSRVFELQHEQLGRRSFTRSIYIPFEAENLRLVVLTPSSLPKK
jgi:transcriptional regulator with XRE-family HTH domain